MRQDREGPIHRAIVAYLRLALPDAMAHHSAGEGVRGGKRGHLDGARRKAMGQVAGWPDIEVILPAHIGPVWFEVKAEGGYASPEQKAVHERLRALGYRVAIVRSIDDVRESLASWGVWTREAAE